MSSAVKVGDEFAINITGYYTLHKEWRFVTVEKVTPSGKLRLKGRKDLWTLCPGGIPGGIEATSCTINARWHGRERAYRLTDENRARYEAANRTAKLQHRYQAMIEVLQRRSFDAETMTAERVALLEQFIEETKN